MSRFFPQELSIISCILVLWFFVSRSRSEWIGLPPPSLSSPSLTLSLNEKILATLVHFSDWISHPYFFYHHLLFYGSNRNSLSFSITRTKTAKNYRFNWISYFFQWHNFCGHKTVLLVPSAEFCSSSPSLSFLPISSIPLSFSSPIYLSISLFSIIFCSSNSLFDSDPEFLRIECIVYEVWWLKNRWNCGHTFKLW